MKGSRIEIQGSKFKENELTITSQEATISEKVKIKREKA